MHVSSRSRRFGQHFLNSNKVAERIVESARVDNELVVEIGPGKGILSRQLAKRARRVIAVEFDSRLADYLAGLNLPSVDVVNDDFLSFDLHGLGSVVVVGNIPYGITTAIIEKLAACKKNLKNALLTVQKEYGSRMAAPAGASDYGFLSVFVNYHFRVMREFGIPPRYFSPKPKVSSVVVTFLPQGSLFSEDYERRLFAFVSGVFRYRRKSLKNAIRSHLGFVPSGLEAGLLSKRPQHLSISDLHRAYSTISAVYE